MDECRRLAPTAPDSQKRILSINRPQVFRVAHGRWRGATWVDEEADVMWLLAAELREEGSHEDAYEHFLRLHEADRLLPTADDGLRDRVEGAARFLGAVESDLSRVLEEALATPGVETAAALANRVEVVAYVERGEGVEAVWLAVSVVGSDGSGVSERVRDVVFALAEQKLGGAEWEWVTEWPEGRDLRWFEVAKLGLRPGP